MGPQTTLQAYVHCVPAAVPAGTCASGARTVRCCSTVSVPTGAWWAAVPVVVPVVVAVDPEWCVMGVLLVVLVVLLSPPPKTFLMLSLIVMVAGC